MTPRQPRRQSFFNERNISNALLYVSSTTSLLLGQVAQLLGFSILARYLGAENFGLLMVISATTAIGLSICGLGTDEVMLRRYVREPALYRTLLGHSVMLIIFSGSLLSLFSIIVLYGLVNMSSNLFNTIEALSIFAFSNIVLARWIMFTETIFIARTQVLYANVVVTGFSIARALAAVIGCMVFGVDRLENWAFWHGATYALGAMGCMFALWSFGPPRWHIVREEIWHGIHAATPQLLSNLRQNIDRPVLAAVTTPSIVGAYSLSSSIVQYSFVTINSFSRLFYPKLALAGQNGTSATCDLAIKYCPVIIGIGIITSIGLFFFAPLLPWVFGNGFTESVRYLKIMCWIPIFVAIHNIAYDALGASENHRIRAFLFNITALGGTGLIAGLTYFYGVYGAFASIFISQTILSIIMWFNLVRLGNNTRRLQR